MRKSTNLWVLLGVLGVLLLCSLGMRRWYVCSWRGECPIKRITEKNGVQLILYSIKRKYVYKRDSLYFRVTIRNTSDSMVILHPVDYRGYPEPAISIIASPEERKWEDQHDLAYRGIPLPPGEALTFELHIPPQKWEELPIGETWGNASASWCKRSHLWQHPCKRTTGTFSFRVYPKNRDRS